MIYIGIDPGKGGAMAVIADGMVQTFLFDERDYNLVLQSLSNTKQQTKCCLERVGAMSGQGVTSMFNFGENFGFIRGLLHANRIPYELVTPQKWKKEFGVTADKNTAIEICQRLFPDVSLFKSERSKKPHDGIAEALLIAEYARRHMK